MTDSHSVCIHLSSFQDKPVSGDLIHAKSNILEGEMYLNIFIRILAVFARINYVTEMARCDLQRKKVLFKLL